MPSRRSILGLGLAALSPIPHATLQAAIAQGVESNEVDGGSARRSGTLDAVMRLSDAHRAQNDLPGLTVAVADTSGWSAQIQSGWANLDGAIRLSPDHLFQIGSITKSLTALCVFTLVEAGKLSLQDRLITLLPEMVFDGADRITLQHLLDHSSGLPPDAPLQAVDNGMALWTAFKPGSRWSYSNTGYALLGHIVARAAGRPFGEALQALVLTPLGMRDSRPYVAARDRHRYATGYGPFYPDRPFPIVARKTVAPWVNVTAASGSVASTAADMAKYIAFLLTLGRAQPNALLGRELAASFVAPTIEAPGWEDGAAYGQGLAFVRDGDRRLLHHTGGMVAFSSALHIDIDGGVGAFASVNVGHQTYRPSAVTRDACRILTGREVRAQAAPRSLPAAFAGRYRNAGGGTIVISDSDGMLVVDTGGLRIAVVAESTQRFIARDPAQTALPFLFTDSTTHLWWGAVEYVRTAAAGSADAYTPPAPPALAALAGTYENDDPWYGTVHIFAMGNRLMLGGSDELTPTGRGYFSIGAPASSVERVRFQMFIAGRPQILDISGVRYVRRYIADSADDRKATT